MSKEEGIVIPSHPRRLDVQRARSSRGTAFHGEYFAA
jgi:hypothetical protein